MSTFRNDHEAALARAEALERQLADERRKSEALSERLEAAEDALRDATTAKQEPEHASWVPPPPPPDESMWAYGVWIFSALAFAFMVFLAAVGVL